MFRSTFLGGGGFEALRAISLDTRVIVVVPVIFLVSVFYWYQILGIGIFGRYSTGV